MRLTNADQALLISALEDYAHALDQATETGPNDLSDDATRARELASLITNAHAVVID